MGRFKYEIIGADGKAIYKDLIRSVEEVAKNLLTIDWQEQLDLEIKLGSQGKMEWPAHIALNDPCGNYLRIEPAPYGLSGSLQLRETIYKFGFLRREVREQYDFSNIDLSQLGPLTSNFILGDFDEIQAIISKD